MLVISHIVPVPPKSGQQQRVKNTLQSLRNRFNITFATVAPKELHGDTVEQMSEFCDNTICLNSLYGSSTINKIWHSGIGYAKSFSSSLKKSNYIIGDLEFSPQRIARLLKTKKYDCVLFEYWHAYKSVETVRKYGVPCVLDMHNVLWQSYALQINSGSLSPAWWKTRQIKKYKKTEQGAWEKFDGIITINKEEHLYVQDKVNNRTQLFYAPMGIDLSTWDYSWRPEDRPQRVGYYGALASPHNQRSALECYEKIMPPIWRDLPDTELWIVGSSPPEKILRIAEKDSRVKVTGFVNDIKSVLKTMSVIVCPWKGIYGFRSRFIEVMALGIPLVTTNDAVYGMELENNRGVLLEDTCTNISRTALRLLTDIKYSKEQSLLAHREVSRLYSLDNTYHKLAGDLYSWLVSNTKTQNSALST